MAFTTTQRAKEVLHITHDTDDGMIGILIVACTRMVVNYLKSAADPYLDSGGSVPSGVEIPEEIELATIFLVGLLFNNPDKDPDKMFRQGNLPMPVTAMLTPLRDPALA